MRRTLALACGMVLAFTVACNGGSSSSPTPSPAPLDVTATVPATTACSPGKPASAGNFEKSIPSGGLARTYVLHVPPQYDGITPVPVVLLFDGLVLDASGIQSYSDFDAVADGAGFVIVAPNAAGTPPAWNTSGSTTMPDDVAFVQDLLAAVSNDLCIDPDRVFAGGYSSGGGMAERLGCELSNKIAAVGLVAAAYTSCSGLTPLIAFHGLADPVVPFEGGMSLPEYGGATFAPIRRYVSEWGRQLGCDGLATITRPYVGIELSTYERCDRGDGEALLYSVIGGGHTWPGADVDLAAETLGTTTQEIDATELMWEFFSAHPLSR